MGRDHEIIAWEHQVSQETIGTYQVEDTASQLFPSIAQEYLLRGVRIKADEIVEQVRSLLGQKLSDL